MNPEHILQSITSLPPEAQKSVIDYISLMTSLHSSDSDNKISKDISKEQFIGMWKDRDDMVDSNKWVRVIREKEWFNSGG